jgi:hypothetical protein
VVWRVLAFGVGSVAATAHAEAVELAWHAPVECPDEAWANAAIGPLLPEGTLEATRAEVTISAVGEEFELLVATRTAEHANERRLRAPTCEGAASAAVAIVALAASREPGPVAPPVPAVPAVPSEVVAPVRWDVGAGFALDSSLLPSVAPGAFVGGGLAFDILRVRLFAHFVPERLDDARFGLAVRSELVWFELSPCLAFEVGRVEVGGCAGGAIGVLSVEAVGPIESLPKTRAVGTVNVGSYVRLALFGWFGLEVATELAIAAPRYDLVVEGFGSVQEGSVASFLLRAGLSLRIEP